jgi:hypothetical protein
LIVQETGWRFLRNAGVTLVAVDSPDSFLDETPTAVLIRQVLGAVAQLEKQALVAKLRKARERAEPLLQLLGRAILPAAPLTRSCGRWPQRRKGCPCSSHAPPPPTRPRSPAMSSGGR